MVDVGRDCLAAYEVLVRKREPGTGIIGFECADQGAGDDSGGMVRRQSAGKGTDKTVVEGEACRKTLGKATTLGSYGCRICTTMTRSTMSRGIIMSESWAAE